MTDSVYTAPAPVAEIIAAGFSTPGISDDYQRNIAHRLASIELLKYKLDNGLLEDLWGGTYSATMRAKRTIANLEEANMRDRSAYEATSAMRRAKSKGKRRES